MKKKLHVFWLLLVLVTLVSCTTTKKPVISVSQSTVEMKIGDVLDVMKGVTATGLKGEDVLELVHVSHEIPLDEGKRVTVAGTYTVIFSMTIDDVEYTKKMTVIVNGYTPKINITNEEINLYVGDKLELMHGVSATGKNGEDITEEIEVDHSISLDDMGCVTIPGIYDVIYSLTIDGTKYEEKVLVNVLKEETENLINGNLETGEILPFIKSDFEGSDSTLSVAQQDSNHLLKLEIKALSWASAAPRIEYNDLVLNSDKIYQISFDAYADENRAMHVQIGELLDTAPWYKAAFDQTRYFDLTTTSQNYSWRFQPSQQVAGADLTNLSLLFEFGTLTGHESVATNIYLDNFVLEEVDQLDVDETAPKLSFKEEKEYFFLNDYFSNFISQYITYTDERGEALEILIDEELSIIPQVNDDSRLTTSGNYSIIFYAVDKAGNRGELEWNFEVKDAYPVTNGFNLIDFLSGTGNDIQEGITQYGYVYAANPATTFSYENGVLTINSYQSQTDDDWTATQIFARTVRQEGFKGEGAKKFTLSFDITSDVEGYIQVNDLPFKIKVGTTKIAIEGNIFNYNYKNLTIVLGVHRSLMSIEQNIGPCAISISNFSFVRTHEMEEDVIAPVIMLNGNKTYFVGDEFVLEDTVRISDFRGSNGATLVVDSANSDEIPVVDGRVTKAGTYNVTFIATDASGNESSYEFVYTIKEELPNSDGFSVEKVEFGEEGTLDDPSVVYLWHENLVNVTSEVLDRNNFKFTTDQTSDGTLPWYATQLFFKSLPVDTWGLYELTFDIFSNVAGNITVLNEGMEIGAGTTRITKKVAIQAGNFQKITMQLGRNGYGTIGECEIEIRNLSLLLVDLPEGSYWEGYDMNVVNNETESVVTYENIPTEWSRYNARTYIFDTTATFQALVVEFIGTAGHRYQFKFEGVNQAIFNATSITATGELQKVIIDTRNRTEAQRLSMFNLLVFVETVDASGSMTIKGYTLYENFADVFETNWYSLGGMDITDNEGTSSITYNNIPANWWEANAQHIMANEFTEKSISVTFTFVGEKDQTYLFKLEGRGYAKENAVVATGEEQEFTIDISSLGTNASKLNLAVVFCQTVGASGTISISQVTVNESL